MKIIQFQYGDEIIAVSVTKSKRKSLSIAIQPDGSVKVRAPLALSDAEILAWMKSKTGWIIRKRNEVFHSANRCAPKQFVSGEKFLFLGEEYELEVRNSDARAGAVGIVEDKLVVFVKAGISQSKDAGQNNSDRLSPQQKEVQKALANWYEKQAKIWIMRRVHFYAPVVNESFHRVTLKNQKKRWGSCSSARNLNFNWRLVMAPLEILDYVVVHELCHLKQMNHSEAFWAEVEKVLPDYKARKKWLDENGNRLRLD